MESKGCLICSSTGTHSFEKTRLVEVAMRKILKYLLIPKDSTQELLAISLNYCESCYSMVNEVVEIAKKIEALELLVKGKSQEIGSKVMRSPVSNRIGPVGINPKNFAMLWERFKKPVIQNFVNKKLPDPSVRLVYVDEKVVKIKKEREDDKMETTTQKEKDTSGSGPKTGKTVSQRVVVRRGIKKEVPIKRTPKKERIDLNRNIRRVTNKITTGVRIGPKCFLKRIGRDGPSTKGVQGKVDNFTPKLLAKKKGIEQKVRVGPKSFLQKIGRINNTAEQVKSGRGIIATIPGAFNQKVEIRDMSLTSSSSSQQPEKAESSFASEELFQEVRLTKSQLDAREENQTSGSENVDSEASTDPFEEYVPDRYVVQKRKDIRRWLESIETPVASDMEEEELLDIL